MALSVQQLRDLDPDSQELSDEDIKSLYVLADAIFDRWLEMRAHAHEGG